MWDFLQRYDESWIWRRADGHKVTESSRNFAAREECVQDAVRHGYIAPPSGAQQRVARAGGSSRRKRKTNHPSPTT
jgi:hypothetical protein